MKYIAVSLAGFVCGIGVSVLFPVSHMLTGSTDSSLSGTQLREGIIVTASSDEATFTHPKLRFSLSYPKELQVSEYDEGGGARTILFQKQNEQYGFQMFVVPYGETTITPERIRTDIPSGIVREPTTVVIGDNIEATVFWSESPTIGESREVWFVHDGYLYEVTTYAKLDTILAHILGTLHFSR